MVIELYWLTSTEDTIRSSRWSPTFHFLFRSTVSSTPLRNVREPQSTRHNAFMVKPCSCSDGTCIQICVCKLKNWVLRQWICLTFTCSEFDDVIERYRQQVRHFQVGFPSAQKKSAFSLHCSTSNNQQRSMNSSLGRYGYIAAAVMALCKLIRARSPHVISILFRCRIQDARWSRCYDERGRLPSAGVGSVSSIQSSYNGWEKMTPFDLSPILFKHYAILLYFCLFHTRK